MSNQQILEKAVRKAINNGWAAWIHATDEQFRAQAIVANANWFQILFNHEFAEAIWGTAWPADDYDGYPTKPQYTPWEHHLREMVIAKDPIKYLGEHL